jgi:V8-like Glu-specific endopeptidase
MLAITLPEGFSERHVEDLPEPDSITLESLQPNSPLAPVTSGPLLKSVVPVIADFGAVSRRGTAFHVGNGIFLSAAHNFYVRDKAPWADFISASINLGNQPIPFAQCGALSEYKNNADEAFDIAICSAPQYRNVTATISISDARSDPARKASNVAGYPRELGYDGTRLYSAAGSCNLTPDRYFYLHKASTLKGDSGGPLRNNAGVAFGIHTQGDDDNIAVALWSGLVGLVRDAIARGVVPG